MLYYCHELKEWEEEVECLRHNVKDISFKYTSFNFGFNIPLLDALGWLKFTHYITVIIWWIKKHNLDEHNNQRHLS